LTVIVPTKNDKDVKEIPANVKRGMKFIYVDHMDQVLDAGLAKRRPARRPADRPPQRRDRRAPARA
jgi:ATP-dependent Lon protease